MQQTLFKLQFIYNINQRCIQMGRKPKKPALQQSFEQDSVPEKKIKRVKKQEKKPKAQNKKSVSQSKKGNEQKAKKQKTKTSAPVGRPKRPEQTFNVKDDPTTDIQQRILQYLDSIGLKHGLVFRNQERLVLKQQKLGIQWNSDHEWDPKKQLQKIREDEKIQQGIKNFVNKFYSRQNIEKLSLIQECLINIGDIAAEECTTEIYYLIVEIMNSITENQDDSLKKQRALKLFKILKFMNGTFTQKKIKYWVQLQKNTNIQPNFLRLFKDLSPKVQELFITKMSDIQQFLKEQKQMTIQLQKIKMKAQQQIKKNRIS